MFKRSLLGYRRADVVAAIALRDGALEDAGSRLIAARKQIDSRDQQIMRQQTELDVAEIRIADLESIATRLSETVVARERELKLMRAELSELNASSDRGMKALVAVAAELDALRGQARGQATRIRMHALSEAAELSDRLSMIAQRPVEVRERLVAALMEAIAETAYAAEDATSLEAEAEAEAAPIEPEEAQAESPVAPDLDPISELAAEVEAAVGSEAEPIVISSPEPEPAPSPVVTSHGNGTATRELVHPADLFKGMVEVEIGPLDDFSQLVGFEDAASSIAGTSEISVKRFAKGRATLEMRIDAPIELLRELEGRAPFEFSVRDTREDRVILDLDDE
ncbi:hypothetical protein BH10ACT11_BH10ACT11_04100 [soil metagenome]